MSTRTTPVSTAASFSEVRTLWLATLGGALEFYDFIIYVFFAPVIGRLFFSPGMPEWVRQFQTFGIFAAGYLARPIGGFIMAHYGDTIGRKRVFMFSVLLMAVPTLAISALPVYKTAGILAPVLLLLMRILQGVAIGGEAPGAWVFVAEHAGPRRVGFAVGLLTGGLTAGILMGSLISAALSLMFTPAQIAAGIWRVPFFIGGMFGFAAGFLRRWLRETPVFVQMQQQIHAAREIPLLTVLKRYRKAILVSIAYTWMLTAAILVVILMTPALLQSSFHLTPLLTQQANLAGTLALCVSVVTVGAATDRFGVRRVVVPVLLAMAVGAYGLYYGAGLSPLAVIGFYVLAGIGAGGIVLTPLAMVAAFPAPIRFTGVSFSYNLAYAVFGGLTPPFVIWLVHLNAHNATHYVAAVIALAVATLLGSRIPREKISEDFLSR